MTDRDHPSEHGPHRWQHLNRSGLPASARQQPHCGQCPVERARRGARSGAQCGPGTAARVRQTLTWWRIRVSPGSSNRQSEARRGGAMQEHEDRCAGSRSRMPTRARSIFAAWNALLATREPANPGGSAHDQPNAESLDGGEPHPFPVGVVDSNRRRRGKSGSEQSEPCVNSFSASTRMCA